MGAYLLAGTGLDLDPLREAPVAHPDVLDVVIAYLLQLVVVGARKAQVRPVADEVARLVLDAAPPRGLVPCKTTIRQLETSSILVLSLKHPIVLLYCGVSGPRLHREACPLQGRCDDLRPLIPVLDWNVHWTVLLWRGMTGAADFAPCKT